MVIPPYRLLCLTEIPFHSVGPALCHLSVSFRDVCDQTQERDDAGKQEGLEDHLGKHVQDSCMSACTSWVARIQQSTGSCTGGDQCRKNKHRGGRGYP